MSWLRRILPVAAVALLISAAGRPAWAEPRVTDQSSEPPQQSSQPPPCKTQTVSRGCGSGATPLCDYPWQARKVRTYTSSVAGQSCPSEEDLGCITDTGPGGQCPVSDPVVTVSCKDVHVGESTTCSLSANGGVECSGDRFSNTGPYASAGQQTVTGTTDCLTSAGRRAFSGTDTVNVTVPAVAPTIETFAARPTKPGDQTVSFDISVSHRYGQAFTSTLKCPAGYSGSGVGSSSCTGPVGSGSATLTACTQSGAVTAMTDGTGPCASASASFELKPFIAPDATGVSGPDRVTADATATRRYSAQITEGSVPYTIAWAGAKSGSGKDADYLFPTAGTSPVGFSISFTKADGTTGSDTVSKPVTVEAPVVAPTIAISGPAEAVEGQATGGFSASVSGASTKVVWSNGAAGTSVTYTFATASTSSTDKKPVSADAVYTKADGTEGRAASNTLYVYVKAKPQPSQPPQTSQPPAAPGLEVTATGARVNQDAFCQASKVQPTGATVSWDVRGPGGASVSFETVSTSPPKIRIRSDVAGSYACTGRVSAGGTTAAKSAGFTITANQPPTVTITAPASGATVASGALVTATATVADDAGMPRSITLSWPDGSSTSPKPGTSHSATFIAPVVQQATKLTINASAVDADGAAGTAAPVTITVLPPATSVKPAILTLIVTDERGQPMTASVTVTGPDDQKLNPMTVAGRKEVTIPPTWFDKSPLTPRQIQLYADGEATGYEPYSSTTALTEGGTASITLKLTERETELAVYVTKTVTPVSGVKVKVGLADGSASTTRTTDSQGRIDFSLRSGTLPRGWLGKQVTAETLEQPKNASGGTTVEVGNRFNEIRLELSREPRPDDPKGATLRVHLIDRRTRRPVRDSVIALDYTNDLNGRVVAEEFTGDDGWCEMKLPAFLDSVDVVASADDSGDFGPGNPYWEDRAIGVKLEPGKTRNLEFALRSREAWMRVWVRSGGRQGPLLSGASIELRHAKGTMSGMSRSDGPTTFHFPAEWFYRKRGTWAVEYTIQVSKPGYRTVTGSFQIEASYDDPKESGELNVTVSLDKAAARPKLRPIGPKQGRPGERLAFAVEADVVDDAGNAVDLPVAISANPLPTGATLTRTTDRAAAFAWTPSATGEQKQTVTFAACLDQGAAIGALAAVDSACDTEPVVMTVLSTGQPPPCSPTGQLAIGVQAVDPCEPAKPPAADPKPAILRLTIKNDRGQLMTAKVSVTNFSTMKLPTMTVSGHGDVTIPATWFADSPLAPPRIDVFVQAEASGYESATESVLATAGQTIPVTLTLTELDTLLTVRVVKDLVSPAPGVPVRVALSTGAAARTGTTDHSGIVSFSLTRGTLPLAWVGKQVYAEVPGQLTSVTGAATIQRGTKTEIRLELPYPQISISGRVTRVNGVEGVAHIIVQARGPTGQVVGSGVTTEEGTYWIKDLPRRAGVYRVAPAPSVPGERFEPSAREVSATEDAEGVNFTRFDPASPSDPVVIVRLVDAEKRGIGLTGLPVYLYPSQDSLEKYWADSDQNAVARFDTLPKTYVGKKVNIGVGLFKEKDDADHRKHALQGSMQATLKAGVNTLQLAVRLFVEADDVVYCATVTAGDRAGQDTRRPLKGASLVANTLREFHAEEIVGTTNAAGHGCLALTSERVRGADGGIDYQITISAAGYKPYVRKKLTANPTRQKRYDERVMLVPEGAPAPCRSKGVPATGQPRAQLDLANVSEGASEEDAACPPGQICLAASAVACEDPDAGGDAPADAAQDAKLTILVRDSAGQPPRYPGGTDAVYVTVHGGVFGAGDRLLRKLEALSISDYLRLAIPGGEIRDAGGAVSLRVSAEAPEGYGVSPDAVDTPLREGQVEERTLVVAPTAPVGDTAMVAFEVTAADYDGKETTLALEGATIRFDWLDGRQKTVTAGPDGKVRVPISRADLKGAPARSFGWAAEATGYQQRLGTVTVKPADMGQTVRQPIRLAPIAGTAMAIVTARAASGEPINTSITAAGSDPYAGWTGADGRVDLQYTAAEFRHYGDPITATFSAEAPGYQPQTKPSIAISPNKWYPVSFTLQPEHTNVPPQTCADSGAVRPIGALPALEFRVDGQPVCDQPVEKPFQPTDPNATAPQTARVVVEVHDRAAEPISGASVKIADYVDEQVTLAKGSTNAQGQFAARIATRIKGRNVIGIKVVVGKPGYQQEEQPADVETGKQTTVKLILVRPGETPIAVPFDPVAPVRITPPGGMITGPVMVRIETATPGATIHYRGRGTLQLYAGPFAVATNTLIEATAEHLGSTSYAAALFVLRRWVEQLQREFAGHQVTIIGYAHHLQSAIPAKLSELLAQLHQQGMTHLMLEIPTTEQDDLDANRLDALERQQGAVYGEMIREAKKQGLKVVAGDRWVPPRGQDDATVALRNQHFIETIVAIVRQQPTARIVLVIGDHHVDPIAAGVAAQGISVSTIHTDQP